MASFIDSTLLRIHDSKTDNRARTNWSVRIVGY